MICPVCDIGTLVPMTDENEMKYNICDYCDTEVTTPKDSRYNKAKSLANKNKENLEDWPSG